MIAIDFEVKWSKANVTVTFNDLVGGYIAVLLTDIVLYCDATVIYT